MADKEIGSKVRPFAILIGGPPAAGKTTLGRALALHLGYSSVTGDDLVAAARAITSAESHPALHWAAATGHVRYFTDTEPRQLIADAVGRQELMWPGVRAVIRSRVADGAPAVIDWWLLSPERVAELSIEVASLWLRIEPTVLERRERSNTEFFEASDYPDRMFDNFMARSLWRNELLASQADRLGMPVLHLGNEDEAEVLGRALDALGFS